MTLRISLALLSVAAFAQTRVHYSQIRGAPAGWMERAHCPGPTFEARSDVQFAIGPNWTVATPCTALMAVVPVSVDPLHIETVTAGCTVTLNGLVQDDLYIWIGQGAQAGLRVGTVDPARITLAGCQAVRLGTPRLFPQNVQVVGMVLVRDGKLRMPFTDIIGLYQMSTTQSALTATVTDAAVVFSPSAAQVQMARALAQPVPLALSSTQQQQINERLGQLEGRVADVQAELQAVPASDQSLSLMGARIEQVSMQASEMASMANGTISQAHEMLYQTRQDLAEMLRRMRVPVPTLPAPPCEDGTWAADSTRYYRCWDGGWHVFRVE